MRIHRQSKGFTLLEIMVAVSILAVALLSIMSMQAGSLRASRRAEVMSVATLLAQRRMVELELELEKMLRRGEFPEERSEGGEFEKPFDDFKWRYEIRRVQLPTPPGVDEASQQGQIGRQLAEQIAQSVREVKLTIFWDDGGKEQTLDVTTHTVKL